ncbi:MAG: DUF1800 domain-containing protein [Acidobacteriaceae bacterium]
MHCPSLSLRAAPVLLITAILAASTALTAWGKEHSAKQSKANAAPVATSLDDNQRILHALDRFTFGPTPGELDQVRAMGVDKWFEQQLHPATINDAVADSEIAQFRTLKMSSKEIASNYPTPQMVRQIADGKMGMPDFGFGADSDKRAIYQSAVDRYRQRQAENQANQNEEVAARKADRLFPADRQAGRAEVAAFLAKPPDDRYKMALSLPDGERTAMFKSLKPDERQQVLTEFTPRQREEIIALTTNPGSVVTTELLQAKLLRETYSNRQLQEVMTDFWLNHFNIFINKGQERYLLTAYERDVIRPHALGKFKDLLLATAHSPAMLFYLDNSESMGPDSEFAQNRGHKPQPQKYVRRRGMYFPRPAPTFRQAKGKRKLTGLNENYAREIMELHTLGVDGGYTQQDVTSLAKVLTGWTITPPKTGNYDFDFRSEWHQPGEQTVLGKRFKDNGEKQGTKALEMLARSPATAHFISKKLAVRFVSDNPPPALVDRMAQTFLHKDGDISQVLRTMYKSPEFWSKDAYRAKVKTPLEFVVSALRATSADVTNAQPLAQQLNKMGMPLYGVQPPTGYPMTADAWVNSAALLARFNFSLALASGKIQGVTIDSQALDQNISSDASADSLATLEARLSNGELSAQSHAVIEKELADPSFAARAATAANDAALNSHFDGEDTGEDFLAGGAKPHLPRPQRANVNLPVTSRESLAIGLILGSPEFQRR